jgi:WD40 repeat protein
LAFASKTGQISLWDRQGDFKQPIQEFSARSGRIVALQFSPDGQRLAEIGEGGTIQLWTLTGQRLLSLSGHDGSDLLALQFSPDGQQLVTAARDGSIRIWGVDGRLYHEVQGDRFPVYHLAMSPDGQRFATGSTDGTARIWDREGDLRIEYQGTQHILSALAFSVDGQRLTGVDRDGQVRLLTVEEEADRLQRLLAKGCYWLEDYLYAHPPIRERLPICHDLTPMPETDGNAPDGTDENGRSHRH